MNIGDNLRHQFVRLSYSPEIMSMEFTREEMTTIYDYIKSKEEEIERLKEELKYTIPIVEHNKTIQSNINSYNKLSKYGDELEDRIDKAIEYIEQQYKYEETAKEDYDILLDILKGVDKE